MAEMKMPRCSSSPSSPSFQIPSSHAPTCSREMGENKFSKQASFNNERPRDVSREMGKNKLSKQLSFNNERPRDVAWEKRRRQKIQQKKRKSEDLTDEDLNELKGSIELGFGFKEEDGQRLCNTLPALDLYFAVNRQYFSTTSSPVETPGKRDLLVQPPLVPLQLGYTSVSEGTPRGESANYNNSWKICRPGDDPQQVKTKLRHWAQAVACSLLQSY